MKDGEREGRVGGYIGPSTDLSRQEGNAALSPLEFDQILFGKRVVVREIRWSVRIARLIAEYQIGPSTDLPRQEGNADP